MSAKNARAKRRCAKKATYATQAAANVQVAALFRKDGDRQVRAYRCPFCGQFHVGHPPRKVRQSISARRRSQEKSA